MRIGRAFRIARIVTTVDPANNPEYRCHGEDGPNERSELRINRCEMQDDQRAVPNSGHASHPNDHQDEESDCLHEGEPLSHPPIVHR